MNLIELEALSRLLMQDDKYRAVVTQPQLRFWLNEAQQEAAIRGRLLYDTGTIAMTAGNNVLDLSKTALGNDYFIFDRFYWIEGGTPLMSTQMITMDHSIRGWQLKTGNPAAYLSDMLPRRARVYPTPSEDYSIEYRGYRHPAAMINDIDTPEIDTHHHANLVSWVLYRAYSMPDLDLLDVNASQLAWQEFANRFGQRPDSDVLNAVNRKAIPTFIPNMTFDASI